VEAELEAEAEAEDGMRALRTEVLARRKQTVATDAELSVPAPYGTFRISSGASVPLRPLPAAPLRQPQQPLPF
jgi:hypothetical protein